MFSISLVPPVKSIHSILQKKVEKERQNKQKCPESWWMLKSAIWQNQEPYYVQDAFYIGKPKAREPKLSRKWNPMQTLPLCTYSIFLCFLLITILILAQCKYFSQSSQKKEKRKNLPQKSVPRKACSQKSQRILNVSRQKSIVRPHLHLHLWEVGHGLRGSQWP